MSNPSPESLESAANFSGIQKEYVDAKVKSIAKLLVAELRAELVQHIGEASTPTVEDRVLLDLVKRVSDLEDRYNEDDRYALTTAKLKHLMKSMGIE
jgi:hypothetical protein